jgi:hypothetical protein
MQQLMTTTTDGRRSSPNPTAGAPYHFALHPGLASEPTGLDPARSGLAWPDPACFYFFSSMFIYLMIKCCDLNQFKNVLGLRKI